MKADCPGAHPSCAGINYCVARLVVLATLPGLGIGFSPGENAMARTKTLLTTLTPLARQGRNDSTTPKTSLLLLNTPILGSPLFHCLWETADERICADGGANRLRHVKTNKPLIPDVIVGDLDSLTDATRDFYAQQSVRILQDPDQDSNDLDKAMRVAQSSGAANIIVYGSMGGRLDQSMACLQALLKYSCGDEDGNEESMTIRYFWYSDTSMACVIPPRIETAHQLVLQLPSSSDNDTSNITEGPTCGLLPIGEPVASVTTTGLQWNLKDQATQFGDGLVSTSNRILLDTTEPLTIRTSHPLVFTAEVNCGMATEWTEEVREIGY